MSFFVTVVPFQAAGEERWAKMLADMDKDHDGKISREEYTDWWFVNFRLFFA